MSSGLRHPQYSMGARGGQPRSAGPARAGWAISRKLIAGTTPVHAGVTTQTVVSAVIKDRYGNTTKDKVFQYKVRFSSTKSSTYAGTNWNAVIIATEPEAGVWDGIYGVTGQYKEVPVGVGVSTANVWFWDTDTGITTITAQARLGAADIWAPIQQEHLITADQAWYLTVHHPFAQQPGQGDRQQPDREGARQVRRGWRRPGQRQYSAVNSSSKSTRP